VANPKIESVPIKSYTVGSGQVDFYTPHFDSVVISTQMLRFAGQLQLRCRFIGETPVMAFQGYNLTNQRAVFELS
jgi:extradiol dioxygenase family protein